MAIPKPDGESGPGESAVWRCGERNAWSRQGGSGEATGRASCLSWVPEGKAQTSERRPSGRVERRQRR